MQGAEVTNDRIMATAHLVRIRVCNAFATAAFAPVGSVLLETELS